MQQLARESAMLSSPLSLSLDRRHRNMRIITYAGQELARHRVRLPRESRPSTGTIARSAAVPARRDK